MTLAVLGATGYTGRPIVQEALARGHRVRALARRPDALPPQQNLWVTAIDLHDRPALAEAIQGCDALLSAFNPGKDERGGGTDAIIAVARAAGIRLLVVGGAGSLEVSAGRRLIDEPTFPAAWRDGALKTIAFLEQLRAEPELEWTFLSPAAQLEPGARSGHYRVGSDQLLVDAEGRSRITTADLAVAMLDEVEQPRHRRQRFGVAY